jgi:predicted TIM-barrel fold metal-dependent hydrolase
MRRQLHATFQDDPVALRNVVFTGAQPVLWGNDYPHEEGTYPHSPQIVERLAAHLDPDSARRIFRDNAAELFHFDRNVIAEAPLRDTDPLTT